MADFLDRESQAYDEMTAETKQMQEKWRPNVKLMNS